MLQVLANIRTIGQALGRSRKGLLPVILLTAQFIGVLKRCQIPDRSWELHLISFLLADESVFHILFVPIGPALLQAFANLGHRV